MRRRRWCSPFAWIRPTPRTNTATITAADQFDPNTGNDTASATETPQQADLALTKTVSDATPNVGDRSPSPSPDQHRPDAATGVQVTDLLARGLTFVSAQRQPGHLRQRHRPVDRRHRRRRHAADAADRRHVVSPDRATNTAIVTDADQFDPDGNNNEPAPPRRRSRPTWRIAKTVSNPTPNVGDQITFTVTLTNTARTPPPACR